MQHRRQNLAQYDLERDLWEHWSAVSKGEGREVSMVHPVSDPFNFDWGVAGFKEEF
jgi:hypothetical protein